MARSSIRLAASAATGCAIICSPNPIAHSQAASRGLLTDGSSRPKEITLKVRVNDAICEATNARMGRCVECVDLPLALAYDGGGDRDSAIAAFERTRIVAHPDENRGPVLRRLGELYDARGDVRNAIDRFQKFVTLWKRADPELQPQVAEVKKKIAVLQAAEARAR